MESRVPKSDRLPEEITLERSPLGGFLVNWSGQFVGWIHSADSGTWNAHLRPLRDCLPGTPLGCFPHEEAIRRIAVAAGRLDRNGEPEEGPADRGHKRR
jgi:hypothetical protein